jgi:hypothetical protein
MIKPIPKKDLYKKIHVGYKTYLIHNNRSRPFLVAIKGKVAKIFGLDKSITCDFWTNVVNYYYTDLIKEYVCETIFVPKGYDAIDVYKHKLINHKSLRGNSILLKLKVKNKYVYIGDEIYEFKTKDEIIEYYSPIGNNDVPYPVAFGKENIYFMPEHFFLPRKVCSGFKDINIVGAYGYYGFGIWLKIHNSFISKTVQIKGLKQILKK